MYGHKYFSVGIPHEADEFLGGLLYGRMSEIIRVIVLMHLLNLCIQCRNIFHVIRNSYPDHNIHNQTPL